jgi:hypothetical protein
LLLALLLSTAAAASAQDLSFAGRGKIDRRRLAVSKAEKRAFKSFLEGNRRAGIVKLLDDPCGPKMVVDINDERCFARSDISFGSHYSFFAGVYFEKYQHINYAAVSLTKGEIVAKNHARLFQLLIGLGDRDLGEIDRRTPEVAALGAFPLADEAARKKFERADGAYQFEGLALKKKDKAELNRTYLLRSRFALGFSSLAGGQKETLFAFRVIGRQDDVITILWKEIPAEK